jgi:hypothetical protein
MWGISWLAENWVASQDSTPWSKQVSRYVGANVPELVCVNWGEKSSYIYWESKFISWVIQHLVQLLFQMNCPSYLATCVFQGLSEQG